MIDPYTIYRYQYGRRDLVMFVRYAGRQMASLGFTPFVPADFSQWDGQTPGIDVGSPRHVSHQRGKDVDLSLYGTDGVSRFRPYCTLTGDECVAGTMMGFDGLANALFFGQIFESGRVTMCFLDRELIPYAADGAEQASSAGMLDPGLVPLYSDGRHLQHWPNHYNHIHVRVSEEDYAAAFRFDVSPEAFEAP
jgi:hypothetical protein